MGQLKSLEVPEARSTPAIDSRQTQASGSHIWIWIVVIAILAAGGFWYYRCSSHASKRPELVGCSCWRKGAGRGAAGG
jgi:hypothetical protein